MESGKSKGGGGGGNQVTGGREALESLPKLIKLWVKESFKKEIREEL